MAHGIAHPKEVREEAERLYQEVGLTASSIADQLGIEARTVQLWCQPLQQGTELNNRQILDFLGKIGEATMEAEGELMAIREAVLGVQSEIEQAEATTVDEKQEIQKMRYISSLKRDRRNYIIRASKLAARLNANRIPEATEAQPEDDEEFRKM